MIQVAFLGVCEDALCAQPCSLRHPVLDPTQSQQLQDQQCLCVTQCRHADGDWGVQHAFWMNHLTCLQ